MYVCVIEGHEDILPFPDESDVIYSYVKYLLRDLIDAQMKVSELYGLGWELRYRGSMIMQIESILTSLTPRRYYRMNLTRLFPLIIQPNSAE